MRLRMLTATVLVLAFAASAMAATTIPLSGNAPQMELTNQSKAGLTYHIEVGQIQALNVSTKGGDFTQLFIPGFHSSMIDGAPELPQMNKLIAVPFGATSRVRVTNVQTRIVKMADYGLNSPVMPHQPSLSKSQRAEDVPFLHDSSTYMSKVERELVSVEYQGRMRAMDIARLVVAPVRYLPATGELEIVESLDFTVDFDGDWAKSESLMAATNSPFFGTVYNQMDGQREFGVKSDLVKNPVKMVVITPPQFEAQMADYIAWKTERGFNVITGVIGSAEVGSTTSTIQAYLHGLYNAATPEDPAPSFVVFVGDTGDCPTFTLSGDASDRPYCETTGDLYPEMYYGRLSATNSSQLQAILDKTLMYDTYSMPDPSYLENVVLIAGMDSGHGDAWGNGTIRYGEDFYYNATNDVNPYMYYYPESGGNAANIIADCSSGIGFINYTAHGSQTSWSDPGMSQSDVNGMTNDGKYFLAVGNCCLTGSYDIGECFGETFIRAANKGAIGYIGGSNSTYWDEDVWFSVGSCPSGSIRDGMTYEETGSGVYDAAFHNMANEINDPTLWYVTNAAVVFRGNLAVSEAGSSREEYYWNIYNLLGDPSISTYMGMPETNAMTYPETVFVGVPAMQVTGERGTYIGCTQDGVLVGTGLVDETGMADVEFNQILTPGVPLKMVAMLSTHVPVIVEMNVIVPAVITIDPMVIDANVETAITVTVMEEDNVTPKPGVNIWAEGLEYSIAPVMTDASGVAVITVNYPYGPSLDIVGQDPSESYRLFTEQVEVNAMVMDGADLNVTTEIGMNDMFPLNLPGTIHSNVDLPVYQLYAEMPDGTLLSGDDPLTVTAGELGMVNAMIVADGYDIYTEAFDVVEAYGSVAGNVTTDGAAMGGVLVHLVDGEGADMFAVTTDAAGNYASPEDVLVDDYSIVVDHFGYLHFEQEVFVNYGENTFDLVLDPAPAGVLTGYVYDSDTMDPLQGTVKVYRTDDNSLFDEVTCDENGYYETASLPYFDYVVKVRAWHHVPVTAEITIDTANLEKDWVLDATNGDLLLIDDSAAAAASSKISEKGELLAPAYVSNNSKAAADMAADLEELGYYVNLVPISEVDTSTFWDFDLVILSCGINTSTLETGGVATALVQFAQEGGHILLEGGELGYDQAGSGDFATYVMHSNDWNHDESGNVTIPEGDHYVVNMPNVLAGSDIALTYSGYGDADAMAPLPDAVAPAFWTDYSSDASVICFDPNPNPVGGQIVYFTFNYSALGEGRMELMQNAVIWLLTPEMGTSGVSGTVLLAGESNHAGITVQALPGGGQTVTAADGSYEIDGLYAGPYNIVASKEDWSVAATTVELADGQMMTGVDLVLTPVETSEYCAQPGTPINDNDSFTETIMVDDEAIISLVEVYVDVTHSYIGDLDITLTAPCGIEVPLHARSGGSTDNLVGWYPADLDPSGDLMMLIGTQMMGEWLLTVADGAGGDTGMLNEWCIRITHDTTVGIEGGGDIAGDLVPTVFKAYNNYPNPFNPMTNIKFDLPKTTNVQLRIYDVAGRLVKELVNESMAAQSHTVVWDGKDNAGRRSASGIYYYRLVTDETQAVKKMTLVK